MSVHLSVEASLLFRDTFQRDGRTNTKNNAVTAWKKYIKKEEKQKKELRPINELVHSIKTDVELTEA